MLPSSPNTLVKSPDQLGAEQIQKYQLFLIKKKGVALPTYIKIVSVLRFLYANTLHRQIGIERTSFPRYKKKLPIILSRNEVKALLEAAKKVGSEPSTARKSSGYG